MDDELLQLHLLKRLPFTTELLLVLCQKLAEHICVGLFWGSLFLLLMYESFPPVV
jgi:hypothetical protein